MLQINPDDKSEDWTLNAYLTAVSSWIEEYLNRPLFYKTRTEFYSGSGTIKLLLRCRPVYTTPAMTVLVDDLGYFGSASGAFTSNGDELVYGTDYCLQLKEEGEPSRSGILFRIGDFWPKPFVRQVGYLSPFVWDSMGNIKITYTAGYTADTLPAQFRIAVDLMVARFRYVFPLGMELGGESYEERSISIAAGKEYIMGLAKPLLLPFRNWKW